MRVVAKRYAKALAVYCKEKGISLDEAYEALRSFTDTLMQDAAFYRFLTTPVTSVKEKIEAAKEYVGSLDLPDYLKNFFLLVVEKGRVPVLPLVVQEFRAIADELLGQVRGVLRVAAPISEEEKEALEAVFSERMGKRVVLELEEDPSIIGGAVAHIGGMVFDGSIKGNLELIKEKLVER